MKKGILVLSIIFIIAGCSQKSKESEVHAKIENTLKSVSFLYDSTGIDPSRLLSIFEKTNKAIDSIGYPDAGYKVWIIQNDSARTVRFMIEGYWPDQAIYDSIHKNALYQNALKDDDKKVWSSLKNLSYNRFLLVK
ncbi:MAG: hypothetical protein ACM3RX_05830 [Methanococcaceae archaeon]